LLFFISDPQTLNQYLLENSDQVFPLIFASYGVAFLVMLVPAILIGASFPLVGQIAVKDLQRTGSEVGKIYAINTIGNVLGALLPGFILLAWLGIQKGILAMAVLNVTLGFVVLSMALKRTPRHPAWRYSLPAVLVLTVLAMSQAPLQFQFPSDGEQDYFQTTFYREGPLATTKVYSNPRTMEKHMSVDGIVIGGTWRTGGAMGAGDLADPAIPNGSENIFGKLPACATLVFSAGLQKGTIQLHPDRFQRADPAELPSYPARA
jgi:MFS family permease